MSAKLKIMIVEDESIVALDIKNSLQRRHGYEVVGIFRSGEEAVIGADKLNPDLILMDIILSGELTGIEAAAKIKQKSKIPVIYLTAFSDNETLSYAKLTEPYGYLLKPLDTKVLYSAIEMAMYKHEAEKRIILNEERYRMLIENSPVAIAVHCGGELVYVNPAGTRLFGASSPSQLIGKPVTRFIIDPDSRSMVRERIENVKTSGMSIEGITEKLITVNGNELDVEIAAIPTVYNEKPAIEIVIRDITEIKRKDRIQKSLLKILQSLNLNTSAGDFFNLFFDTLKEYIPIKNFLIAFYSARTGEISFPYYKNSEGDDHRELTSGLIEYTIKKNRTVYLKKNDIEKLFRQGDLYKYSKKINEWISVPLEINDEITGVIASENHNEFEIFSPEERELFEIFSYSLSRAIARKISEEEKEKAFIRLQELNSAKNKFFSTLSHDLRNNLNAVLGYTDLLKNEIDRLTDDEVKSSIDSLYSSTRKIYNLTENLLRFTRYSSDEYMPKLKIFPLQEMFGRDMFVVQALALKKQIEIEYNVDPDIRVFADEEMISSILQNLLLCAVKYSENSSRVSIRAYEENNVVNISVSDNSTGMEEYLLKNLFITKETTPDGKAAEKGIGYLFIREILQKTSGSITVSNIPGQGSHFSLQLPAAGSRKSILT